MAHRAIAAAIAAAVGLGIGSPAAAQQCTDVSVSTSVGTQSALKMTDRAWAPGDPACCIAHTVGSFVFIRDFDTLTQLGASVSLTDDAQGADAHSQTSDGSRHAWVTRADGYLTSITIDDQTIDWSVYLGRGSGCSDKLTAAPIFHRHFDATPAFNAEFPGDLVYAGTEYCATNTDNRVYAIVKTTGATAWRFNGSATVEMDRIMGMLLDAPNDVLYVTTDRRNSGSQHSVWAIDVLTGAKLWSVSAGPLWMPPTLRGGRLYVADIYGNLRAIDTATGNIVWTLSNGGLPFVTNVEAAMLAPHGDLVVGVALNVSGAEVWTARDNGTSGSWAWDEPIPAGLDADNSVPMHVDSEGGAVYVGANDGKLYELDLATGNVVGSRIVDPGGNGVNVLEIQRPPGTNQLLLVAGSSTGGKLAKFCVETAAVPALGPGALGGLAAVLLVAAAAFARGPRHGLH